MIKLCLTLALCTQSLLCMAQSITPGVPLDRQLQEAIAKDDAPKVAYMLRELAYDPNFYLPNGDTPLVFAIRMDAKVSTNQVLLRSFKINGQTEMVRFLIQKGAEVNARTERGVTPLYMASRIIATSTVDALLKAGADKTLCTDQGISPAAIAQKRGDSALAQKLQISACAPWPVPETDSPSDSVPIESADSQNNSESAAQTSDQGTRP